MTPSLEGWPTKAKEAPSPHGVIMAPLDTNPVFQCLGDKELFNLMIFLTKATVAKQHNRFFAYSETCAKVICKITVAK